MSAGVWFWLIYVLVAVFGLGFGWHVYHGSGLFYVNTGISLIHLILLGLLGWKVFGKPVKD